MSKRTGTSLWAEWLSNVKSPENDEMLAGFREWMRKEDWEREKYTKAVMKGWLAVGGGEEQTLH